ncbi:hypothetical protein C1646_817986 [Rhizophagus diaphanus]|nr:hypothetical protein C1646_817986 [Rhizophagus diaphanus] [Rhizophagus sp. MUCL 43196]
MESYLSPNGFVNSFYQEINRFLTKNFRDVESRSKWNFQYELFKQTDNEKLRGWLREANARSRKSNKKVAEKKESLRSTNQEKKSSRLRNKKVTSMIHAITVLVEEQELASKEKAQSIFFYDIPAADILLKEEYKKMLDNGCFGMDSNKNFARWYDGSWSNKDRRERDRWDSKNTKMLDIFKERKINGDDYHERGVMWVSMIGSGNQVVASVPTISEGTVVDTINQWRRDINISEDNMVTSKQLQKYSVQMEEVVKVAREYRKQAKLKKEIVDNIKNLPKNKTDDKLSMFHAKFSLNDATRELEYDLSNPTLHKICYFRNIKDLKK